MATRTNVEIALDSLKRIGSFSEGEKDALTKAFRTAMFPGNWSIDNPSDNDVLVYDLASNSWNPEVPPGGTWLSLSDTPNSFVSGNRLVRINTAMTALEFHQPVLDDNTDITLTGPSHKQALTYNSGGFWENADIDYSTIKVTSTKGDLVLDDGSSTAVALAVGTDTHVLTADSAQATGVKWAASPSGFADPMTARGDIIVRNASNVTAALPIGANNYVLKSDGTDIAWAANAAGATVFTGLSDVPASYAGQTLKLLRVNAGETAVEFVTGGSITQVTATLPLSSSGGTTPDISIRASTTSVSGSMSAAQALKLDGIATNADVTSTANVTAAGAWMGEVFIQSATPTGVDGDVWYEI